MSIATDNTQPSFREWWYEIERREDRGVRLSGWQLAMLDRAAVRGFLFDPDPKPRDFPREGGRPHWWPESMDTAGEPNHFQLWDEYCYFRAHVNCPWVIAGRCVPDHKGGPGGTLGVCVRYYHPKHLRLDRYGWAELVKLA
jgi:hypothetical protein